MSVTGPGHKCVARRVLDHLYGTLECRASHKTLTAHGGYWRNANVMNSELAHVGMATVGRHDDRAAPQGPKGQTLVA
jgi:hypothetical protein